MSKVLVLGAGEQGRVIRAAINADPKYEFSGFLDDGPLVDPKGLPIFGGLDAIDLYLGRDYGFFVALGDNHLRGQLCEKILSAGGNLETLVHSSAIVSDASQIGVGSFVGPRTVVANDSYIGRGVIVDTGSIIEHDCYVGDFANVSPGGLLVSGNRIGEYTHIGAGSIVNEDVSVGSNCVVGAGSLVLRDVPDSKLVFGHPAKVKGIVDSEGKHRYLE